MTLQNGVMPDGPILAGPVRGALMGNDARICPVTGGQKTHEAGAATLPDGTFICLDDCPVLIAGSGALPYPVHGFGPHAPLPTGRGAVITPQPVDAVLSAGCRPCLHPSA